MATVSPISDSLSAPPSSALVLPPTNTTQFALGQPAIDAAQDTLSTTGLLGTSAETATSTSPLGNVSSQPLAVVLDALASAGVDNALNDSLLAQSVGVVGESAGTFSNFMEELFTTLAAQSAATQSSTTAPQTAAAAVQTTTAAQLASAVNAPSTAANSAFESDLQNLAQIVTAGSSAGSSIAPLQQSFSQLVAGVGGTASSTSLGGFLQALAGNLHTAQSPRGNIVNFQA